MSERLTRQTFYGSGPVVARDTPHVLFISMVGVEENNNNNNKRKQKTAAAI